VILVFLKFGRPGELLFTGVPKAIKPMRHAEFLQDAARYVRYRL
jgi:hypothetical protein